MNERMPLNGISYIFMNAMGVVPVRRVVVSVAFSFYRAALFYLFYEFI